MKKNLSTLDKKEAFILKLRDCSKLYCMGDKIPRIIFNEEEQKILENISFSEIVTVNFGKVQIDSKYSFIQLNSIENDPNNSQNLDDSIELQDNFTQNALDEWEIDIRIIKL